MAPGTMARARAVSVDTAPHEGTLLQKKDSQRCDGDYIISFLPRFKCHVNLDIARHAM
jgi:hypothetical protein